MVVDTVPYFNMIYLLDQCDRFELYELTETQLDILIKRTADTPQPWFNGVLSAGRNLVKEHYHHLKQLYKIRDKEKDKDSIRRQFGHRTGIISIYTMLKVIKTLPCFTIINLSEDFIDDLSSFVEDTGGECSHRRWFRTSIIHLQKLSKYKEYERQMEPELFSDCKGILHDLQLISLRLSKVIQSDAWLGNRLFEEPDLLKED